MARFDIDSYEPVQARIRRAVDDHGEQYAMHTLPIRFPDEGGAWVVRAEFYVGDRLIATGYAEEVPGQGNVNRTSALENCETSAVGRALANAGYSPSVEHRPSLEELQKADRHDHQLDAALDILKGYVEQLSPDDLNRWHDWKRTRKGWQNRHDQVHEATRMVGEWLADDGVEPFGDVTTSDRAHDVAPPPGAAVPSVPGGESLPPSGGGTEPAPPETPVSEGLVVAETEQQGGGPSGEELAPDDLGGYLHPSGRTYPWPAGRITAKWKSDELAAWLLANGETDIPDGKTARLESAQRLVEATT